MSFKFTWPTFEESDYDRMRESINQKLSTVQMEPPLVGILQITKMSLGTVPPKLKILEIGKVELSEVETCFGVEYSGDAYIEIISHVQINPFAKASPEVVPYINSVVIHRPLVIPLCLHVSNAEISGVLRLKVSQNVVSMSFADDPLKGLCVNSTFSIIHGLKGTIQKSVEDQIRNFFMVLLPELIVQQSEKMMNAKPNE